MLLFVAWMNTVSLTSYMLFLHRTLHSVDCLSDASVLQIGCHWISSQKGLFMRPPTYKVFLKVILRRVEAVLWEGENSLNWMRGHNELNSMLFIRLRWKMQVKDGQNRLQRQAQLKSHERCLVVLVTAVKCCQSRVTTGEDEAEVWAKLTAALAKLLFQTGKTLKSIASPTSMPPTVERLSVPESQSWRDESALRKRERGRRRQLLNKWDRMWLWQSGANESRAKIN